jgi:hypothetical protein
VGQNHQLQYEVGTRGNGLAMYPSPSVTTCPPSPNIPKGRHLWQLAAAFELQTRLNKKICFATLQQFVAAQRKDVTNVLLSNHSSGGISVQIIPVSSEETATFRQNFTSCEARQRATKTIPGPYQHLRNKAAWLFGKTIRYRSDTLYQSQREL